MSCKDENYSRVRQRYASKSRADSPNTENSSSSNVSDHHANGLETMTPLRRPTKTGSRMARLRGRREPLLDQHFRVNRDVKTGRRVVLPGIPRHDPDWARDLHDFFNLAILVPVVTLNIANWNWDTIWKIFLSSFREFDPKRRTEAVAEAWTGEYFEQFLLLTAVYFCVDLAWIIVQPRCVKSPLTIIQHHIATLLYMYLPFCVPECQWVMGACMMVEINTWFLIARRVFNRQNFPPTVIDLTCVSIRVKVISLLFYISWIGIRCVIYPYLMPCVYEIYLDHSLRVGTRWNLLAWSVPLHAIFCLLNLKWSYDLLMSKLRYWRRRRLGQTAVDSVSNGL